MLSRQCRRVNLTSAAFRCRSVKIIVVAAQSQLSLHMAWRPCRLSVLGGHAACIFRRPCRLLLICSRWDVVVVIVVVIVVVAWRPCRLYFRRPCRLLLICSCWDDERVCSFLQSRCAASSPLNFRQPRASHGRPTDGTSGSGQVASHTTIEDL